MLEDNLVYVRNPLRPRHSLVSQHHPTKNIVRRRATGTNEMSKYLSARNSAINYVFLFMLPLVVTGCAGIMEEHRRASAIQAQGVMNRTFEQYQNAGTTNPQLWYIQSDQAVRYHEELKKHAASDIDSYLAPTDTQPVACDLNSETTHWLAFQMSPRRLERTLAAEAKVGVRTQSTPEVTLRQGACASGKIEGDFVASYRYNYTFENDDFSTRKEVTGRVEGTMKNGVLDGELRATSREKSLSGSSNVATTIDRHDIRQYEDGKRTGSYVHLSKTSGGEYLVVSKVLNERRELHTTLMNHEPNTRYYTLDGLKDGYMQFANAMLSDDPSCYRNDQQLSSNAYCDSIADELATLTKQAVAN